MKELETFLKGDDIEYSCCLSLKIKVFTEYWIWIIF